MELFSEHMIVGVFHGFSQGGLEFHADLVLPYRNDFQSIPMHGQFLLVRLESEDEAVLGRNTYMYYAGKLASGSGEEFNIRAVRENRAVPEDLREQYLRYKIDIRVLGVVRRKTDGRLTFVASHRRLPHVGSPVAFLSNELLKELTGHSLKGAPGIGHFALGEYVYAGDSEDLQVEDWLQVRSPEVLVKFSISNLVSRRSFIFARAGFGKSNLNKLLFSELYKTTPTVEKRGKRQVPVGTVIFDPDGEYFWPDDKGRPGLCDVPELEDKLVVFTNRQGPSDFYQSFVAGGIRLDIRRLKPADVISIALSPERQDQQNVRKLRGLRQSEWEDLVNAIDENGHSTPIEDVRQILKLESGQEAEAYAARANMTNIVKMLHDKSSQLMDRLLAALAKGKLCVVDVSQMRGGAALILSSLIMRRIFDKNQQEFTSSEPKTIPTIAVIEEAQSVLNEKSTGSEPYIAWVKEGRKYDLGAVMITQQPGSIPVEILSQGDNWFIFHLLSAADLNSVRNANAHFSNDILSILLNEPIPGHGVFWSSASPQPYPISIRVLSFEHRYKCLDPEYNRPYADTFALRLKKQFDEDLTQAVSDISYPSDVEEPSSTGLHSSSTTLINVGSSAIDPMQLFKAKALTGLSENQQVIQRMKSEDGYHWRGIKEALKIHLPINFDDPDQFAYELVPLALDSILGEGQWETYKSSKGTTYARKKK